ncbi:PREDICTED: uncharacterized protein LOC105312226 [Amphimedon queenslandica]|uniref:EF-hand domain-containing protein n=1 Tax=Amphimedon queenslandica TaxID=400682 RepID=A0A1X7V8X6_AMPQE|nr:PREDICTED: uncharacterized protein LOC105312226 [Amphimedon queenslandica]|eukprot:XP_019850352.1 PREDICTED: uncharacterized protein LOC105312226 [Amphimedon queenslandica]
MGQGGSHDFQEVFQSTVAELSQLQLAELGNQFNELYRQAGGERGRVIDREKFSLYFNLPVALGDRLFDAFDKKKNGSIDFEEFVCGLSIILHGSFSTKCQLLFDLFNISGDEGVSREELHSLLSSVVHSTNTIILTVTEGGVDNESGIVTDPESSIASVVDAAFENCDISRSGKLLPLEFEYWLKRNPQVLDYLLPKTPEASNVKTRHGSMLATLLAIDEDEPGTEEAMEITPLETTPNPIETTSIDISSTDIDMEDQDERNSIGQVEPPPSDEEEEGEENKEEGEENKEEEKEENEEERDIETQLVEEGKEREREEKVEKEVVERKEEIKVDIETEGGEEVPGTEEGEMALPETVNEQVSTDKEKPKEDTTKKRESVKEDDKVQICNLTASEETLKLARQLSKDFKEALSPTGSDDFILPTQYEDTSDSGEKRREKEINDDILCSWLPGEWVQQVLASGRIVSPEHLTQPGLISPTGKSDPIGEVLMATFPGSERRQLLTADQVTMDHEGLMNLIHNGCYHEALRLTSLVLSAHGQGINQIGSMTVHTHKTLQMWCARLSLLCQLERYDEAKQEMEPFKDLDQPDLYYQYNKHNYPGKKGSMVPYSMRLLHAQLPLYTGNIQLAMNRVCFLQYVTGTILRHIKEKKKMPFIDELLSDEDQQLAEEVWTKRLAHVKCLLGNCLLSIKDYSLVRNLLHEVIELLPDQKVQLLSCLGRLCISYGNLVDAEDYFSQVLALLTPKATNENKSLTQANKGLVNIYHNQWIKAENDFKSSSTSDAKSLYNSAMCALYQGKLQQAITSIEDLIKTTSTTSYSPLQVSLFKVLFSLYELESSKGQAKKLSWLPFLGYFAPEGFSLKSTGMIA